MTFVGSTVARLENELAGMYTRLQETQTKLDTARAALIALERASRLSNSTVLASDVNVVCKHALEATK